MRPPPYKNFDRKEDIKMINTMKSAGRKRLGLLLLFLALRPAKASEITFTLTGTLTGGPDTFGTFGIGNKLPSGTPFKLVFTFDDTKGKQDTEGCGSGINGDGAQSPGKAVLTIGSRSFTFGVGPTAKSGAWRSTCDGTLFVLTVGEGRVFNNTLVGVRFSLPGAMGLLMRNSDWRSALTLPKVNNPASGNGFGISREGDYSHETNSDFEINSVVVSGPHPGPKVEARVEPKPAPVPPPAPPVAQGTGASKIFVLSDDGGTKVTTYSPDGKRISPTIWLGARNGSGLALDSAGRIYVAINGAVDQIMSFNPDSTRSGTRNPGNCCFSVALSPLGFAYGLAVDRQGNGVVKVMPPSGAPGQPDISTGLSVASAVAVDAHGTIFVVSKGQNVIKTYDASGRPTDLTIRAGVDTPTGVAIDSRNGRIYVSNWNSVTTYTMTGQRVPPTIIEKGDWDLPEPTAAVAVDASGRIYVGYQGGKVGIYEPNGKLARPIIKVPSRLLGIAVQ